MREHVLRTVAWASLALAYIGVAIITLLAAPHTPWPALTYDAALIMGALGSVLFVSAPFLADSNN